MASPDLLFAPRLTDAEVTRRCLAANDDGGTISHAVAHSLVARRVTIVADPHVTDGPIGRFVRTGEVPPLSTGIWWPLYGPMCSTLPAGMAAQAAALGNYLDARTDRSPVEGWPCADTDPTRED
jgi:hypothetical protein